MEGSKLYSGLKENSAPLEKSYLEGLYSPLNDKKPIPAHLLHHVEGHARSRLSLNLEDKIFGHAYSNTGMIYLLIYSSEFDYVESKPISAQNVGLEYREGELYRLDN